jgi:membrane-bound lytic murein transglycosylase D
MTLANGDSAMPPGMILSAQQAGSSLKRSPLFDANPRLKHHVALLWLANFVTAAARSPGGLRLLALGWVLLALAGCGTLFSRTPPQASFPPQQPLKQAEAVPPVTEMSKSELVIPDQPVIDKWTDRFSRDKHKSFQVQLDRARNYVLPCQEIFKELGLPPDLVYVALVESGFTPTARSRASAVGMFQFISSTGKRFKLQQNEWVDERCHPFKAARAAAEYLSFLYDTFGSWPLAVAAYNCGEKAVQTALDQSGLKTFWELAQYGYLPSETRDYVPKVYATVRIVRDVKHYGFHYDPQHYEPKHETVPVPGGVKLAWIEKKAGVSESSLINCNPELCRPVTPPGNSTYDLCVPIGTGESVQAALASCPLPEDKPTFRPVATKNAVEARNFAATAPPPAPGLCTVKPGDTWFSLARKYQCSVDALASVNGLKPTSQSLKKGQTLKIPGKGQTSPLVAATSKKDTDPKQPPPGKASQKPATVVPLKQVALAEAKQPGPASPPAKTGRAAQKACVSYPVRAGDTLWSIAGKFRVPVQELCANNQLHQGQKLVAGNTLNICNGENQSVPAERTARKKN